MNRKHLITLISIGILLSTNLFFIESSDANCNPSRRIFGWSSGCENTQPREPIFQTHPTPQSHTFPMPTPEPTEAERQRQIQREEDKRREATYNRQMEEIRKARQEESNRRADQLRQQQEEANRRANQQQLEQQAIQRQQQEEFNRRANQQFSHNCRTPFGICNFTNGPFPIGSSCICGRNDGSQDFGSIVW